MKAISVIQPWAWCIVAGGKDIENRTWRTNFRGPVLIHAGKKFDMDAYEGLISTGEIPAHMKPEDFIRGGIVGMAEIVGCTEKSKSSWFMGPYGFMLENQKELPFMPVKGQLGFFEVDYNG